jgi:hypothetical protein
MVTFSGETAAEKSKERQIPAAARLEPRDRQVAVSAFYKRIYGDKNNMEVIFSI